MNVERGEGKWVLGDRNARCPYCGAPAVMKKASNGRAELWHAPTDCCDRARLREKQFDGMRRREAALGGA